MTPFRRSLAARHLRVLGIRFVPRPAASPVRGEVGAGGAHEPGAESLEEIRGDLGDCRRCPLCRSRSTIVFGVGNPRARLMFVGEGPGVEEDRQGEPFVGAAGKRLTQWIRRIGLSREEVYIANVVKCRPPGNRTPAPEEAQTCLPFLIRQIRSIRPEAICVLGAVALAHLVGTEERITRVRGTWRQFEGIPVLPTYHPAYILRNAAREPEALEDFDRIAQRLGLRPPG